MKKNKILLSVGTIITLSCIVMVLLLVIMVSLFTYGEFSRSTKEAITKQASEISNQIVYNFEIYIDSMVKTSNVIRSTVGESKIITQDDSEQMSKYFKSVTLMYEEMRTISLFDGLTGEIVASSDKSKEDLTAVESEKWFVDAQTDSTVYFFSVPFYYESSTDYLMTMSRQVTTNGGEKNVMKITITVGAFLDLVKKTNLGDGGKILILDNMYNLVFKSGSADVLDVEVELFKRVILGSQEIIINGNLLILSADTLSNTRWEMGVFVNVDDIKSIEGSFVVTMLVVSFVVLIGGLIMFAAVSRRITTPLGKLDKAMKDVENANYLLIEPVSFKSDREIKELSDSFNNMMKKIRSLMDDIVSEKNEQRKSELKALQNQINPHFLYNTMDSIIWLIEQNKNDDAAKMLYALAKLFRIGISRGKSIITVEDEINHIKCYLLIQSIRYGNAFKYSFDIDDSCLKSQTIKIILQPLVENALYHGLKNNIDEGEIKISVKNEDDKFVVFSVEDNGYGIETAKIDKLYEFFANPSLNDGVGLKNIYQRLLIYYGGKARMKIESKLDCYTRIIMKIPMQALEEMS